MRDSAPVRRTRHARAALAAVLVLALIGGCDGSNPLLSDIEEMVEEANRGSDTVKPTVGSATVVGTVTQTTVNLSWGEATDDRSTAEDLEYMVVYASSSGALGSIDLALQATVSLDWTAATTSHTVSGLEPVTEYWFAVLTRDEASNTSLYTIASATTLNANAPTASTGPSFSDMVDTQVTVSWGTATDDDTAAGELEYKLVRASSAAEIDTAAEADAITGAAVALDWAADTTTHTVTGLAPLTTYAFAVLVRDAAGNLALYAPQTMTTLGVSMTVTFDPQGGATPEPQTKTVRHASGYGPLATTTRSGYALSGWWTGAGGTGTQVTETSLVSETTDHKLFAAWEMNPWVRTVVSGGSTSGFRGVALDASDNVFAVGSQWGDSAFTYDTGVSVAGGPSVYDHGVIVMYNTTGTAEWAQTALTDPNGSMFNDVAADGSGNAYVVGGQSGTQTYEYATGVNAAAPFSGEEDWGANAVIVKYNAAGTALWARVPTAGTAETLFDGVAIDAAGNVYAVGFQQGTGQFTYQSDPEVAATGPSGGKNALIVSYDADGAVRWARTPTNGGDVSLFQGVAVDGSGNVYVVGYQSGMAEYTYGPEVVAEGISNGTNAVLVKYDSSGTAQWARTVVSGISETWFRGVAVDATGNVYAVGNQRGTSSYGYGDGVTASGPDNEHNAVVVKFSGTGTAQWARSVVSGSDQSYFYGVATDGAGNVYAAGRMTGDSPYTFDTGVSASGPHSYWNAVIVMYDTSGTAQWVSTPAVGADYSFFDGVAVDSQGQVYTAGVQRGSGEFRYHSPGNTVSGPSTGDNALLVQYTR